MLNKTEPAKKLEGSKLRKSEQNGVQGTYGRNNTLIGNFGFKYHAEKHTDLMEKRKY
jgi:hypothetical protein